MPTKTAWSVLALTLLLAACDSGNGGGGNTTTSEPSTTTTEASGGAAELEASGLTAGLEQSYQLEDGQQVETTDLPAEPGSVTAHWYQAGGEYVVLFAGFEATEAICPGSSLGTAGGGFEHVSNTPVLSEEACEGFTTSPATGFGARVCDGLVVLGTDIPVDGEGTLYASLEVSLGPTALAGVTSSVAADATKAPEIDVEASGYTLAGETFTC